MTRSGMMEIEEICAEDVRRTAARVAADGCYDPATGAGSPVERREVVVRGERLWLPATMVADSEFKRNMSRAKMRALRYRHDFEYWAWQCVRIRHKLTGQKVALRLNGAQRKVLGVLEGMRLRGEPIRVIMLKARQWGGSTLVEMYFAWIQLIHKRNWNSLICAHVRDTASSIRSMYTSMLADYPAEEWAEEESPGLRWCQSSRSKQEIVGRGGTIAIGSSMAPEALRGNDAQLAHLSEVAFWHNGITRKPLDFLRSVTGTVPLEPLTAVVLESTANGVGNYFHRAWVSAERGESGYRPVFVAWYEIEMNAIELSGDEARQVASTLSEYERELWSRGVTLGQIEWYRRQSALQGSVGAMRAEFPSTASEAFVNTGNSVFGSEAIGRLRRVCREPAGVGELVGEATVGPDALHGLHFVDDSVGRLKVWRYPDEGMTRSQCVVAVDIGGRSAMADWSVISVIDRRGEDDRPEVVAQWRGHADHDIVGWQAAALARWYGEGLLVVESNTLESECDDASEYILTALHRHYRNIYRRQVLSRRDPTTEARLGFHTNRQTKQAVITELVRLVRDDGYTERDTMACDELMTYETRPSGAFAAKDGCHDDILMTRAIGLYVITMGDSRTPAQTALPPW